MSHRSDPTEFAARLRRIIDDFRRSEKRIREEYARGPETSHIPEEITERATRRFLVDEFLCALAWDPGDPASTVEEARARHPSGDWLFLDYLGVDSQSGAPAVIFEAKKFDIEPPRAPRAERPASREMPALIADAIDALRFGNATSALLAEWTDYLGAMHRYLQSVDSKGRANLQRAVISSGGWMIVFEDPCETFLGDGSAEPELIHCFVGFDEILTSSDDIFELLHRERLVDTLPPTLDVTEALEHIPPDRIERWFRGALIATSGSSGTRRASYPTRAVYPALILRSGSRWFAIGDFNAKRPVEEPRSEDSIGHFLEALDQAGTRLEEQVAALFGMAIEPSPLEDFPGFTPARRTTDPLRGPFEPMPGSTADMAPAVTTLKAFTTVSDDAMREFVVVVGTDRFYKTDRQRGPECPFHYWKAARAVAFAEKTHHEGFTSDSFTEDGQERHCAHAGMLSMRADRCRIRAIETHVCCRACVFETECWSENADRERMPCPALPPSVPPSAGR